ncbi:MAG: integrase [Spirochaetia bacterium]|nr:integrase [Spirochaetia bacterium]
MSRKPFYLSRHGDIWYARIVDQKTGKQLSAISTGQSDRDLAVMTVSRWFVEGLPKIKTKPQRPVSEAITVNRLFNILEDIEITNVEAERIMTILKQRGLLKKIKEAEEKDLITYLLDFYNYETSPYVREKLAHGQSIGRTHCKDSIFRVKGYWKKYFGSRTLSSITREDLRDFSLSLVERKYAASTINKTMIAGKVAFAWAYREGYIHTNPADKLANFVGKAEERGILNDEETNAIFKLEWKDNRSLLGNRVASTCGLRSGEVLGLKSEDIGLDRLFIRHSYSTLDGLKTPKNGEQRQVPLLPEIREQLLELVEKNPWEDGFIFYSDKEGQPMDHKLLNNGLTEAMLKIGITKEEKKSRNLVFHSWRHRYAAKMSDLVDARSLGLATGHKTMAMLEHYAAHANEGHFKAVSEATEKAFGKAK